jgi:hypothetical protein
LLCSAAQQKQQAPRQSAERFGLVRVRKIALAISVSAISPVPFRVPGVVGR